MLTYKKNILSHEKFYLAAFTKNECLPYLIFIHGGPGLNCGTIEYLIENEEFFTLLDCNIVLYDQRGCGKSVSFFSKEEKISHSDNVNDLQEIYQYLTDAVKLKVKGLIGHSYGAKLLFDFYRKTKLNVPGVFVSTADSILTPRLNNLMSDLVYLKKTNPDKYQESISKMDNMDLKTVWQLTEELAPFFLENKDRHYLYWANLSIFEKIQEIQKKLNLSINQKIFMDVRKDLYSNESNYCVEIDTLNTQHIWINGFQDYIMGEPINGLSKKAKVTLFSKSAHYPHIEENKHFCEVVNEFTKKF